MERQKKMGNELAVKQNSSTSLVGRFSEKYGVDSTKLLDTLKATAFKQSGDRQITNEQMCALMIVSEKYDLNPFLKEIHAYPEKQGGIVPVIGVDGWDHIMNSHPAFDGVEFRQCDNSCKVDDDAKDCPEWIEAVIYRKDRSKPIIVREYIDECYKPAFEKQGNGGYKIKGPWQTHTKRQLRHKALIQCARIAFGFSGVYDEDEGRRVIRARDEDAIPSITLETTATVVHTETPTKSEPVKRARKPKQEQVQGVVVEETPEEEQQADEQAPTMEIPAGVDDLDIEI